MDLNKNFYTILSEKCIKEGIVPYYIDPNCKSIVENLKLGFQLREKPILLSARHIELSNNTPKHIEKFQDLYVCKIDKHDDELFVECSASWRNGKFLLSTADFYKEYAATKKIIEEESAKSRLEKLLVLSAKEHDRFLKPKTNNLIKELGLDTSEHTEKYHRIDNKDLASIVSQIAKEFVENYGIRNKIHGKIEIDHLYINIKKFKETIDQKLQEKALQKEQEFKLMSAQACLAIQKPLYYSQNADICDKNNVKISKDNLNNLKSVIFNCRFNLVSSNYILNGQQSQEIKDIHIVSLYEDGNNGWIIESDNAIYTNIDFRDLYIQYNQ